jgi:hypothetical protein
MDIIREVAQDETLEGPAADENSITQISEWKNLQTTGNWDRHASQCQLSVDGCGGSSKKDVDRERPTAEPR